MNEPVVQQSAEECSECGALQALQTLPHKDDTEEFPRIIADNWLWIVLRGWWTLDTGHYGTGLRTSADATPGI